MFPRQIPQDVKNKVYEVTQDVFECEGKVETEKVRAALEENHGICFFNTIELEKLIKEGLDKQIFAYKNNGTAQEVSVQEQYVGKCEHCGYDNEFKLPVGKQLPDGVKPKFCAQCGKETQYSKMVNQKYLQEDAKLYVSHK